jgi:plasmid stability protein
MRTTIDIPDAMYRHLKARAASEGRSVKALILQAAAQVVASSPSTASRRVRLPLVPSKRPHSLALDNERIYDVIAFP